MSPDKPCFLTPIGIVLQAPASPTSATNEAHKSTARPTPRKPVHPIQRVETREQLGDGLAVLILFWTSLTWFTSSVDLELDQAPYRFKEGEPPGQSPLVKPTDPQPTMVSSPPVRLAPQPVFPPTALAQVLPDLQPPDPNSIYDRLRYFEGMSTNCSLSPLIPPQELPRISCKLSLRPRAILHHHPKTNHPEMNHPQTHSRQHRNPVASAQRGPGRRPNRPIRPPFNAAALSPSKLISA